MYGFTETIMGETWLAALDIREAQLQLQWKLE